MGNGLLLPRRRPLYVLVFTLGRRRTDLLYLKSNRIEGGKMEMRFAQKRISSLINPYPVAATVPLYEFEYYLFLIIFPDSLEVSLLLPARCGKKFKTC